MAQGKAVASLARDLAEALTRDSQDVGVPDLVDAMWVLACVHRIRCQLLPEGRGSQDLQAYLTWSAELLQRVPPHLISEEQLAVLTDPSLPACATAADINAHGAAIYANHERTGYIPSLQAAVSLFAKAVDATPTDHPDRAMHLSNLGAAQVRRYRSIGDPADLEQGIALLREAAAAAPAGHPAHPHSLSNLARALSARFEVIGDQSDLDKAITAGQEAVDSAPADDTGRPAMLCNLANALLARFESAGEQADLNQAIDLHRAMVDGTPATDPSRPGYLSDLGTSLGTRYEHTGQQADLDQAITVLSEAVDGTSAGHPSRPRYLSNLGNALQARFARIGQQADLDQAITVLSEAVDGTSAGHPSRPTYLSNLGLALLLRFMRTGQDDDLKKSGELLIEARDGIPAGDRRRPGTLSALGSSLWTVFEHTKEERALDVAIACLAEAVVLTPAGPIRPRHLSNLGNALRARSERAGHEAELDQAVACLTEALDLTPADYPARPDYACNLGAALQNRFERRQQRADLNLAISVLRDGAKVPTGSPARRVAAASGWGLCARLAGDLESAVAGYTSAIELLPLMAWHGLDQASREHHLKEWAGLASAAAAAAVAAGDPARAVELLEAGRSMLWTQALHLREDLAGLRERAPELAEVLDASRTVLNTTSSSLPHESDEQQMLEARRRAARDWDTAVNQARLIEGFEHFLRPVPFEDLRAAASGGPVAIVNISQNSSQALIVTPPTGQDPQAAVLVVDLPSAPRSTVTDQANSMLDALDGADQDAAFAVLAWCWQTITEPILNALGYTRTPKARIEDWPRVWWSPTGAAATLPLHAAGRDPRGADTEEAVLADTVAGRVISSYAPTLGTLIRGRARPVPSAPKQLAVGIPEAPGYADGNGPLPKVAAELKVLSSHLAEPQHASHLPSRDATRQAVMTALPAHSWVHLACHGVQHTADASLSAFLLYDQPLTMADLAALHLGEPDLAYLSACHTAAGNLRLPDEALHLAAAMQLVGYRHVLATMWSILDADAPKIADTIYAHLVHPDPDHPGPADEPAAARAPYALHHAVIRLRQKRPNHPLRWASYIHLGP
jgi:tetratricopeptide (TPR) repeat protein